MASYVVLLRAIGPLTHKVMSMAAWRDAVAAGGFSEPQTYIATGNMIVESDLSAGAMHQRMNEIVLSLGLGPANVAVVRTALQLRRLVRANPFPAASADRANQMGVYFFAQAKPGLGWVADYRGPEHLSVVGEHLIVDYSGRISESLKLPGIIEKRAGVATARNWNTLVALAERATAREHKDD